jgi:hypothetical protein
LGLSTPGVQATAESPSRDETALMFDSRFGLASRSDLLAHGISDEAMRAKIVAGKWQRVLHGVYANFTGPLTRSTELRAAVLYAGHPVAVSHSTAAEVWRIVHPAEGQAIHLTVPYGHSARAASQRVVVHRSRAFRHLVIERGDIPLTGRADTVLDIAVEAPTPADARRQFLAIAGSCGVSPWTFRERIALREPRRYRKALSEAVDLYADGVCSALEARYMESVEQAHGIPAGRRQTPLEVDGHTLYEDVTYDELHAPLTVRLDGRQWHSLRHIAFRDRRRDNAAELAERSRLIYGWDEVDLDPCGVSHEVLSVLRRYGWQGAVTNCPRCEHFSSP